MAMSGFTFIEFMTGTDEQQVSLYYRIYLDLKVKCSMVKM